MEFNPGGYAVKTVEMTTEDLKYYINLLDKAAAGFQKIDFNFEGSSTGGKNLSNSSLCFTEIICERKHQSMCQTRSLCSFKKLPQSLQP